MYCLSLAFETTVNGLFVLMHLYQITVGADNLFDGRADNGLKVITRFIGG